MKTSTLIKKLNQKDRLLFLGTDFADKYARCKVEDTTKIVKQFSKQLDVILGIK